MSVGIVVYALGDLQLALFGNYILHHVSPQTQLITFSRPSLSPSAWCGLRYFSPFIVAAFWPYGCARRGRV
jgi:hypothetical protein